VLARGVAGLRQVSEGQYVAAGTDIARLEKIDQLKLDFRIPESYIGKLKAGQPVKVLVDAYRDKVFSGSVYAIEPGVDDQTRTIQLRARVANADMKLRPGMFARGEIEIGRSAAFTVPLQSVVSSDGYSYVFVLKPDHTVERRRVEVGAVRNAEIEVVSGIEAGEMIVGKGAGFLKDGDLVNVSSEVGS